MKSVFCVLIIGLLVFTKTTSSDMQRERIFDLPEEQTEELDYRKDSANWSTFSAIVDTLIELPCNTSPPSSRDSVALILWYKDETGQPLYSVDARNSEQISEAKHFSVSNRVTFDMGSLNAFLRIDPVKEEDTGVYRCRVDFRRGRTINRVHRLDVIVPIKKLVILQNNGQVVEDTAGPFNEDAPINLTCVTEGGNPTPIISWFKGSAIIDDTSTPVDLGKVVNILHLPPLKREDLLTILTCKASNNNLTEPVSKSIAIDLNLKPRDVRIVSNIGKLTVGHSTEIVCQSTGSKPSAHIEWQVGSSKLEGVGEQTSDDGLVTTSFLSYVPAIEDNMKKLSCIAKNPQFREESFEKALLLDIHFSPLVYLVMGASIHNEKILAGSDVFFDCNVQANPSAFQIGWTFNDKPLDAISSDNLYVSNNSLLVKKVHKKNQGRYQCWAVNEQGRGDSKTIDLNVQFSPICAMEERKNVFAAAIGEQVEITCNVDADPARVIFHWSLNKTSQPQATLESTESRVPWASELDNFKVLGLSSVLKYRPYSEKDYGTVLCWAVNGAGTQTEPCQFFVIPANPPETPSNCSASNITMDSFTVSCSPGYNGGFEVTYHLELYHLDGNALKNNLSTGDYPFFLLKSLASGSSYQIKLYASNIKGRSDVYTLQASTQLQAHWQADASNDIVISQSLACLMVVIGCLSFLGCIAMVKLRWKSSACHGKDNGLAKIEMTTIPNERQQMIFHDETSNLNFKSDLHQYNSLAAVCGNHVSESDDYLKAQNCTINPIIVPHVLSPSSPICLSNDHDICDHSECDKMNEQLRYDITTSHFHMLSEDERLSMNSNVKLNCQCLKQNSCDKIGHLKHTENVPLPCHVQERILTSNNPIVVEHSFCNEESIGRVHFHHELRPP